MRKIKSNILHKWKSIEATLKKLNYQIVVLILVFSDLYPLSFKSVQANSTGFLQASSQMFIGTTQLK
jgi:hypothetical protein